MALLRARVRAYILLAIFVVHVSPRSASAEWFYYFGDQRRALTLDVTRIAILPDAGGVNGPELLASTGFSPENVEELPVANWLVVTIPSASQTTNGIRTLVTQFSTMDGIEFASPVFVDDQGGPLIVSPDILVRFHKDVDAPSALTVLAQAQVAILEVNWADMDRAYRTRANATNGFDVLELANQLAQATTTEFAEPDMLFTGRGGLVPNDPGFPDLWGLDNTGQFGGVPDMDMDAPEAWELSIGDPNVLVVIIDTGVQQDHPDLNLFPGTDVTSNASTTGGPVNVFDNHGTTVAGCVSAIINNNLGTVGVAPGCRSASVRTFIAIDAFGFWTSQASWTVNALAWAESIGARVTNNSNFYGFTSSAIASKYADTRNRGIIHFASAGNNGLAQLVYPAVLPSVHAVAALAPTGSIAFFSNHGPGLAFSAPGTIVFTTDRTGASGFVPGDFVFAAGTSYASPYAAGVAALAISAHPTFTAEAIDQLLRDSSIDLGPPGYDTIFGWGFVNAAAAVSDCNENGIPDQQDVAVGTSADCNANLVPDECESDADCNHNGLVDICDLAAATSLDCNGNRVPDECEPNTDCNENGLQDVCDVAAGTSPDCNANGIPDQCDVDVGTSADCNSNGVPDECDPDDDCDNNGMQDICDVAQGAASDCNGNEVPDACELFDCGNASGACPGNGDCCDSAGNASAGCDCSSCCSAVCAFDPFCCEVTWDSICAAEAATLSSCPCALPAFSRDCNGNGVPDECDVADATSADCNTNGVPDECDPDGDCNNNAVQDICDVASGTSPDCNGNEVPDECESVADCDNSGVADICEIASGARPDCNSNGIPDGCDLANGASADCNANDLPDECEVNSDCNDNDVQDICDVADGTSDDCNENAVPDECELFTCDSALGSCGGSGDCCSPGGNGTPGCGCDRCCHAVCEFFPPCCDNVWDDFCAFVAHIVPDCDCGGFSQNFSSDCNENSRPDECDVADGTSADCNANGIPDECEPDTDCNNNNMQDICDVADGASADCNSNGIPDECEADTDCNNNSIQDICDVADGASADCNGNEVPDECDDDCNQNGRPDTCDLADEISDDCNNNGEPDQCDLTDGGSDDCNSDGVPDECQIEQSLLAAPNLCVEAQRACPGMTYTGTTISASADGSATCGASSNSPDRWYRYTPVSNGTLEVFLCGSSYDTVVSTHTGCPGEATNQLTCNDDACGLQSIVSTQVRAGITYRIRVSGFSGAAGGFTLQLGGPDCQPVSMDCNNNQIPDECEPAEDCNDNGLLDFCEPDCNESGFPDDCDIASGTSQDCDSDSIPDECDSTHFSFASPPLSPIGGNSPQSRTLRQPPPAEGDVTFSFAARADLGALFSERVVVRLNGSFVGTVFDGAQASNCPAVADTDEFTIPASRFSELVDGGDALIEMIASSAVDEDECTLASFITVALEYETIPDCNHNGVLDECDITDRVSEDCDENGLPDECDQDCNGNGVADNCESDADCNANDILDICDLATGSSLDCNVNSVPDECDTDFDLDGTIDDCDECPFDPNKTSLGQCGCGVPDDDTDGDGSADCVDGCAFDPNKTEPGVCGCGNLDDGDSDGDSVLDCDDQCPGVDDSVFAPECAGSIPAVSSWGMLILMLLLLTMGKIFFNHRESCG